VDATRSRNEYLDELNPAQREAATFGERRDGEALSAGPLLVVAGAGTGKTMTLAHRVAHLVVEGVDTRRILLLTFTRRAALEMTRRVESILRQALADRMHGALPAGVLPWSGTFHSVGNRLLRRFAQNLGLDPGFSVLDRGDAADLMDVVRHELGLSAAVLESPRRRGGFRRRNRLLVRSHTRRRVPGHEPVAGADSGGAKTGRQRHDRRR
jgi:DNA helicase-2/ATP-dependent DNA helicase PcrA